MKRLLACILSISMLTGFCTAVNAEVNKEYYISSVKQLQGDEYSKRMKASVYGFEETDKLSLRMGCIENPGNELKDKISEYITSGNKYCVYEFSAYDSENDQKTTMTDKTDMQITLSGEGMGSGFLGIMGKDYKVLRIADTVTELPVTDSDKYSVTFETNEMGIFAVIYNPNALTLTFISDFDGENETVYKTYENLNTQSVIELPEPPVKDGFKFAGWYTRQNGEGKRLYPGAALYDIGDVAYAHWISDGSEYSSSDASLESIVINDSINCTLVENQHIYFVSEAKDLTNINVLAKPKNPYSYVYCGNSVNNIGSIDKYPFDANDGQYSITKSDAAHEARLYVKVISEDLTNEETYSFIFADDAPSSVTPIDTFKASAGGCGSFVLTDSYSSAEIKIGESQNPDGTIQRLAKEIAFRSDSIKYFDLLAYDGDTLIDTDMTGHLKVTLSLPESSEQSKQCEIYRQEGDKLIPQRIISQDSEKAVFEADKTGHFVLLSRSKKSGGSGGLGGGSLGGSKVIKYTVAFETNGGSPVSSQSVQANNKASEPDAPKKDNFVFGGWFTDKELSSEYDFTANVTENITLYAKWNSSEDNSALKDKIILTVGKTTSTVFGESKQNDVAPTVKNDRAFLPARFVAESLGASVNWNETDKIVTITKGETEIIITIGSETAMVNGKSITLDHPAFVENDRTFTPIRFISENLGATVDWNNADKSIIITRA